MLVEFSLKNAWSFKEQATLSFSAAALKAENANPIIPVNDNMNLLKATAIYGANASGKSNLIKSMALFRGWVLKSASGQAGEPLPVVKYELDAESENEPLRYEATIIHENIRYRYGFTAEKSGFRAEWLYGAPNGREALFFEREGEKIELGTEFKEARELVKFTRDNALFLSVAAQFNISAAIKVLAWFRNFNVIHGLHPQNHMQYTLKKLENPEFRGEILNLVKSVDLGIEDIIIREQNLAESEILPEIKQQIERDLRRLNEGQKDVNFGYEARKMQIKTLHKKFGKDSESAGSVEFDLDRESHGTIKFLGLSGPLIDSLQSGKVLVIDEIEAQLHPLITEKIISLFNSDVNKGAQLIFVTHDPNLLRKNLLRRDQVWFVEKNDRGESSLYPLTDFRVRQSSNIYKEYLEGHFGGIPLIREYGE